MRVLRRTFAAAIVAVALSALLPAPAALADDGPVLQSVSPRRAFSDGKPIHLTLTGTGLAQTTQVIFDPPVPGRSFIAFNDATLLITLPAGLEPGTYSVRVVTPSGGSDPANAPTFDIFAAPPSEAPTTPPDPNRDPYAGISFAPAPSGAPATPPVPTAPAAPQVRTAAAPPASPLPVESPFFIAGLGILLGLTAASLWGRPGRMSVARHQGVLAQLVGRPAQRVRLGRICLQCGRLHLLWRTRRDLWRAGQYCSATCFVASQDEDVQVQAGDNVAGSRLREVVVFGELERELEAALRSDAENRPSEAGLLFEQMSLLVDMGVPVEVAGDALHVNSLAIGDRAALLPTLSDEELAELLGDAASAGA